MKKLNCALILGIALLTITTAISQVNDKFYAFTDVWNGKLAEEIGYTTNYEGLEKLGLVAPLLNHKRIPAINNSDMEIITDLYRSFSTHDMKAVKNALDKNIEWYEADHFPYADGNPYMGPDAVITGVFSRISNEWENWKITDLKVYEMANGNVLGTGRYQAKCKKNGKTINAQFAHLWKVNNGKVTNFRQYVDTKQIADVMHKF